MIVLFKAYVDDLNKKNIEIDFDSIINLLNIINDKLKEFSDNILTPKNMRTIKDAMSNDATRYKNFKEIENAFQLYLKIFRIKDRDFINHFNKLVDKNIEPSIKYFNKNISDIFSSDMSKENIRVKEVFVFMYLANIVKIFDIVEIFILALRTKSESLPGVVYEDLDVARSFFNFLLEIKNKDISYHLKMLDREKMSEILIDKDAEVNVYRLAEKKLGSRSNFMSSGVLPFSNYLLTILARQSSKYYGLLEAKKNWVRKKIEILEYESRNGMEATTEKNDILELITSYKNQYLEFIQIQDRLSRS